jgi:hypothetical protein
MFPGVLDGSRTRNRRLLKPLSLPRLEYEHREPPPGADPGRPPYESGAAAVRGGMASGAGLEPAEAGSRAPLGTPTPHPETVRKAPLERADREGLSARGLPVAFTPACAAPESNRVSLD